MRQLILLYLLISGGNLLAESARAADPRMQHEDGDQIRFPSCGVQVRDVAVLLGIDSRLLELTDNLCVYLSKPAHRKDAVLRPDRSNPQAIDFLAVHFYGSVLYDGGKYRMWYYPVRQTRGPEKLALGPPCYAESDDGISWVKPILGQVEVNGSKQNNALALVDGDTLGVNVIKDDDDPNSARRYKMLFQYMPNNYPTLKTATSADGLVWTVGQNLPQRAFREQASLYKHNGRYVVCGHADTNGEGGHPRGRQAFTWPSPDFDHWPIEQAEAFLLPEPPYTAGEDRAAVWSKPFNQVHVGIGATSLGSVAVGVYGLWHERGWGEGGTTCDLGLVLSHDGLHFFEPVPGRAYLKADDVSLPPVPGKKYPTVFTQGNGILNVGDETRIYYGRWRNTEWPVEEDGLNYYAEVGLATLPRDRWGALGLFPGASNGSVWSAPITLPDSQCTISLNADAATSMHVEIADVDFKPHPDFSEKNAGICKASGGLDCEVTWPAGELKTLAGKTVRLRIELNKTEAEPRLFAVYVRAYVPSGEVTK